MALGAFITFEGPEGAGKSTQVRRAADVLRAEGHDVLVTREPGGTALGEELRRLIMHVDGDEAAVPEAELLLFGASRAQLVRRVIGPHLETGGIVLCDRFADSTTVYQGIARGLDRVFVRAMHAFSIGACVPILTLLLDMDADAGLARTRLRDAAPASGDRIESESLDFHRAVRRGFLDLATAEPARIRVVCADGDEAEVHLRVMEEIRRALG